MGQLPYFVHFGKGSWNIYAYREVTFPCFFWMIDWISLNRTSPKTCHPKWVNRGSRHAGGTLPWQMLIYPLSWSNWQYLDNVGSISGKSYRRHRLLTGWLVDCFYWRKYGCWNNSSNCLMITLQVTGHLWFAVWGHDGLFGFTNWAHAL